MCIYIMFHQDHIHINTYTYPCTYAHKGSHTCSRSCTKLIQIHFTQVYTCVIGICTYSYSIHYVYACKLVCVYLCMCVHVMHLHIQKPTYTYIHVQVHVDVRAHIHMYTHCTCIQTHICIHRHTCILTISHTDTMSY